MFTNFSTKGWHGLRRDGSTGSPCTDEIISFILSLRRERSVERQTCLSVTNLNGPKVCVKKQKSCQEQLV